MKYYKKEGYYAMKKKIIHIIIIALISLTALFTMSSCGGCFSCFEDCLPAIMIGSINENGLSGNGFACNWCGRTTIIASDKAGNSIFSFCVKDYYY